MGAEAPCRLGPEVARQWPHPAGRARRPPEARGRRRGCHAARPGLWLGPGQLLGRRHRRRLPPGPFVPGR
eukprot:9611986-Alexandrium_andersonii.AAC.1